MLKYVIVNVEIHYQQRDALYHAIYAKVDAEGKV